MPAPHATPATMQYDSVEEEGDLFANMIAEFAAADANDENVESYHSPFDAVCVEELNQFIVAHSLSLGHKDGKDFIFSYPCKRWKENQGLPTSPYRASSPKAFTPKWDSHHVDVRVQAKYSFRSVVVLIGCVKSIKVKIMRLTPIARLGAPHLLWS